MNRAALWRRANRRLQHPIRCRSLTIRGKATIRYREEGTRFVIFAAARQPRSFTTDTAAASVVASEAKIRVCKGEPRWTGLVTPTPMKDKNRDPATSIPVFARRSGITSKVWTRPGALRPLWVVRDQKRAESTCFRSPQKGRRAPSGSVPWARTSTLRPHWKETTDGNFFPRHQGNRPRERRLASPVETLQATTVESGTGPRGNTGLHRPPARPTTNGTDTPESTPGPHPPNVTLFRMRARQSLIQPFEKEDGFKLVEM